MSWNKLEVEIEGVAPTILQNGQCADPMNPFAKQIKAITSKGKKQTDADRIEVMRLEWHSFLYLNAQGQVCWPGENIEQMIRSAAKAERKGKSVETGLMCPEDWPILYDGPKTVDGLWADERFRNVSPTVNPTTKGRVMRCRPMFSKWCLRFQILWNDEQIGDVDTIRRWLDYAGANVGLSTWRPKHGRFVVKRCEEVK
jgi:hypothetical protein